MLLASLRLSKFRESNLSEHALIFKNNYDNLINTTIMIKRRSVLFFFYFINFFSKLNSIFATYSFIKNRFIMLKI